MKFKRITALLLAIITIVISANLFVSAQSDLPFTDVKATDWFYNDVYLAYGRGLINGKARDTFAPNDNLKYSEAVKLAACMRVAYFYEEPLVVNGKLWYDVYVDYCKLHGIIDQNYEWNAYATRADFMEIFAAALPNNALEAINAIEDGSIPDVPMYHKNAEAIYKLYRAGIVQGSDSAHRCNPVSQVKRSEVAAILTRMMYEYARLEFSLYLEDEKDIGGEDNKPNKNDKDDKVEEETEKDEKPEKEEDKKSAETEPDIPDEKPEVDLNGKCPEDFTLEDYNNLTSAEKTLFPDYFDSMDAYLEWYDRVVEGIDTPETEPDISDEKTEVDLNGKHPEDFTLEDYNKLTSVEKTLFPDYFESMDAYLEWYDRVVEGIDTPDTETDLPETKPDEPEEKTEVDLNGKHPEEFTLEDYNDLTPEEKALFPDYFESMDAYLEWYDRVIGD